MTRRICVSAILLLIVYLAYDVRAQSKDLKWSVKTAKSFIEKYPDPDSIHWAGQTNSFSWQAGYVMFAMEKMWRSTGDSAYLNYIKKYVDSHIDEKGNVPRFSSNALDNFLPGYAVILMYEHTKKVKYKKAAETIRNAFQSLSAQQRRQFLARRLGETSIVGRWCVYGSNVPRLLWESYRRQHICI